MELWDMLPIHIINLPHRPDRRASILAELNKHNITNYDFVEAIPGSGLNLDTISIDKNYRPLRPNEIGCYLSHVKVYEKILLSDQEIHLILEDDVYFINNFKNKLFQILDRVKLVEWDVFYIGINCYWPECKKGKYVYRPLGIYYPDNIAYGTHAYLIKKSTINKIYDSLFPIRWAIDVLLTALDLKRLSLINTIAKVDNIDSDTQK